MSIMWCLPERQRDALIEWADMSLDMWNSLSIEHQLATVEMEYNEFFRHRQPALQSG